MDAYGNWWVSALTAKKTCLHEGWEETKHKCYDWLHEMKKNDEVKKTEEEHWEKVSHMIKKCRWKCRVLA